MSMSASANGTSESYGTPKIASADSVSSITASAVSIVSSITPDVSDTTAVAAASLVTRSVATHTVAAPMMPSSTITTYELIAGKFLVYGVLGALVGGGLTLAILGYFGLSMAGSWAAYALMLGLTL